MPRTLRLGKEALTELGPDELAAVQGGAPPTLKPGCQLFSDLFSCVYTYGYCPPPPAHES